MFKEVLAEHYLVQPPSPNPLNRCLIFENERVILVFDRAGVRIFTEVHPPLFDYFLMFHKSTKPMTTLDVMNLRRALLVLSRCPSITVEYCDPDLIPIIDRKLGRVAVV